MTASGDPKELVQVIRVLIYTGTREWVEKTFAQNWVKGFVLQPNEWKIQELLTEPTQVPFVLLPTKE